MACEEGEESLLDVAIYKLSIVSRTDLFYIGSSVDIAGRMKVHIQAVKNSNSKLYKTIRECGGKFEIEILYEFQCANEEEQRQEEQIWIDELKPPLNSYRAYRSDEQRHKAQNERYINNRERITNQMKVYNYNNRERISKKRKEHYERNKTEILKKVTCICGCEIVATGLAVHMKNKKHHKLLAQLNSVV